MKTGCVIAGGGPAGMMLGYLLARAGIEVMVLEKHADFLRDFRGDTLHPSTLELMYELGLLHTLLQRAHQIVYQLAADINGERIPIADFSQLSLHCPFLVLMPQWDFLDYLAQEGRKFPTFHLKMQAEVTELILNGDRVAGLRVETPHGTIEVEADLVIGADGRSSTVRERAGLQVMDLHAPMDVLWMRLSRHVSDPLETFGYVRPGHVLVMLNRGDYWQCGFVLKKGGVEELRRLGIEAFRELLQSMVPELKERFAELQSFADIKLLTVRVDRLKRWYRPGLLCIGDAAHAMSPVGGVGINLAIQDAVAAANLLQKGLRSGPPDVEALRRVEARRMLPTYLTQRLQLAVQERIIRPTLAGNVPLHPGWPLRLLRRSSLLRRIPAQLIGIGFRPEHVA